MSDISANETALGSVKVTMQYIKAPCHVLFIYFNLYVWPGKSVFLVFKILLVSFCVFTFDHKPLTDGL